jgi:membrane-associated protein
MDFLSGVLDLFLHLDAHLGAVIQEYGLWTYVLLFVIVFLETGVVVTPFLPGDSLLFAGGAFAAKGDLGVGWLFLLLTVAAIAGDTVNYWIGHAVGPKVFTQESALLRREHLLRTQRFYEKHGGKTIFLARFIPIIRTFAPFVAGIGRMAYGRFVFYNVVGAVAWTGICLGAGYFFGNLPFVRDHFSLVVLAIIAISVTPLVIELFRQRRQAAPVERPVDG